MERNHPTPSNARLLARALTPSAVSVLGCFGLAAAIVVAHIIMVSLSYGTVLPSIFNGDFAAGYTNHIVQPIETLLSNTTYARALTIVVWGCIGLVFYLVVATIGGFVRHWREAEEDVEMVGEGRFVHPSRRSFASSVLWRMALSIVGGVVLVLLQPVFKWMFKADGRVFSNTFTPHDLYDIFLSIVVWAFILHGVTVFLRLYLLRTRLLGEIIE